ncbi:DHHC palmitoyltransferase-like protein 3 [Elsinoe fawcettii]|nr:DHHC palmitoyltransferase-like protein 3 [Elsinoe fawcettii]
MHTKSPSSGSTGGQHETTKNSVESGHETQHELEDIKSAKPPLPIEEDLMGLARLGELRGIQKLFDSGKYSPNSADEQGITALHWAAINGHYALCHFLLQAGADVNAKGGDAVATPVLWASRKCQLDVVNLLLQHGADALITDDAGYNLLHCVTLDGNVFQLILLLHQPDIRVDAPDSQGHTSLMWAAYKGFPACVDVLLRWGANVNAVDGMGFTALHWALVKGNFGCIQKLVEYGADRFAANNEGKTPSVTAREMNSTPQWHRALLESGFDKKGNHKDFPLSFVKDRKWFLWRLFFLWPFVVIGVSIWLASSRPIYIGLPFAMLAAFGLQWLVTQSLRWAPSDFRHVHKTPYFAGVFAGTLLWVGIQYTVHILPTTSLTSPILNLLFILAYLSTAYFYFSTMLSDPGYVPKSASRGQSKTIIEDLISHRAFDETHFCSYCMIRKPLRSKHCKRCARCVAREDHHCPWVDNCVGVNNHRHFVLYLLSLMTGIAVLIPLFLSYLELSPSRPGAASQDCTILSPALCTQFSKDPFTSILMCWTALQLTWVSMLLAVHMTQIARAMTTYESMRGHVVSPLTSALATGSLDPAASGATDGEAQKKKKEGWWATWKRLLGLDAVVSTAMYGSRAEEMRRQKRENPYSHGCLANCKDFWCDFGLEEEEGYGGKGVMGGVKGCFRRKQAGQGLLGGEKVDFRALYDVPSGGMRYRRGGYESVPGEEGV